MERLKVSLPLAVYLGLSPIYWLPGLSVYQLRTAKMVVLAAAVVLIWTSAIRRHRIRGLPSGIYGPTGLLILLVLSAPGFLQAAEGEARSTVVDYLTCYLVLWTTYIARSSGIDLPRTLAFSATIIVPFALLPVITFATGWPSWHAPPEFDSIGLVTAGFGARRTGWSNGLALFVPALLLLVTASQSRTIWKYLLAGIGILTIIGSQMVVAGRAGLLASFIGLAMIVWLSRPTVRMIITLVLALSVLASVLELSDRISNTDHVYGASQRRGDVADELTTRLRLDRLESTDTTDRWDRFSAGRLGAYEYAIEMATRRPFLGYGFGNAVYSSSEIHNLWLKLWVESGIFLPLAMLGSLWLAMRENLGRVRPVADRNIFDSHRAAHGSPPSIYTRHLLAVIIFQGVLVSLFEPNALIGSFQATAIWWFCAGTLPSPPGSPSRKRGRQLNNIL